MTQARVSIVVPAYNAAAFIEKTLERVRQQTFRDFEVLVVDDGSQDDTHRVADGFLSAHRMPGRCIRQENKKIAAARNTAIAASSGKWIAFLDHDDLWYPEKLAAVMEEVRRHPEADIVHHPCRIVDKEGREIGITRNGPAAPDMYRRLLLRGNALCPSSVTVRKAKVLEVGGFRENPEFDTVEDYDLWMRLAKVSRFRFIAQILGDHLMVSAGASKRIRYHHDHQEALLLDHFRSLGSVDPWTRLLMRRRLAMVYRAAARAFLRQGNRAESAPYVAKALAAFPLDARNLALPIVWVAGRALSRWPDY